MNAQTFFRNGLAGSGAFGVQHQDAFDFDNGLGVLVSAMA
jgi:hypothetical protein